MIVNILGVMLILKIICFWLVNLIVLERRLVMIWLKCKVLKFVSSNEFGD